MSRSQIGHASQDSSARDVHPELDASQEVESAPTVVRGPQQPVSGGSGERARLQGIESLIGTQLGPYLIETHIGSGGMGTVFRARDVRLNRYVALKVLPPEFHDDPVAVRRFHYEAQWAARLDHENIARVYDIGSDKGYHYIAFEYVDGRSVRDLLAEQGRLDQAQVVAIALQVVNALCHAAARGVVHRDIKPSNLIITRSGRVKLVDMGLARTFERRAGATITETGMTLGTFDYIAPEQARDPRRADVRSDIYSLGCTLFHMLTGRPPYVEQNPVQKLLLHQNAPPPNVADYVPGINRSLARILTRMMQKDPADRYQSPEELWNDLVEVASELNLKPVSSESLLWIRRRWPDWTAALLVGVWATVVVLVVALLLLVRYLEFGGRAGTTAAGSRSETTTASPALGTASSANEAAGSATSRTPTAPTPAPGLAVGSASAATDTPERLIRVKTGAELREALNTCPDGAVIELVADSRAVFDVPADGRGDQEGIAGLRLHNKHVTIRPASGLHPVIRLRIQRDRSPDVAEWVLFELHDATLRLEHVTLEITGETPDSAGTTGEELRRVPIFFVLSGSTVDLRDVVVIDSIDWGAGGSGPRSAVFLTEPIVQLGEKGEGSKTAGGGVRTRQPRGLLTLERPRIALRECLVGPVGVLGVVAGVAEFELHDTTVGWARRALVAAESGFSSAGTSVFSLTLDHSAIHVARGPAFEFLGYESPEGEEPCVQVRAESSLIANVGSEPAVLMALDETTMISWAGSNNAYYGFAHFLGRSVSEEDGASSVKPLASSLWEWQQMQGVQESGGVALNERPWTWNVLTANLLPNAAPTSALVRGSVRGARDEVGPRYLPLRHDVFAALARQLVPSVSGAAAVAGASEEAVGRERGREVAERGQPGRAVQTSETGTAASTTEPSPGAGATTRQQTLVVDPDQPGAYASLADAIAVAPDGATIVVQVNGEVRVPPTAIKDVRLTVRAGDGVRPTLVLDPLSLTDLTPRASLFTVTNGRLRLEGIDVEVASTGGGLEDAAVTFTLIDSRLELDRCRIVVGGTQGAVVDVPARPIAGMAALSETGVDTDGSRRSSSSAITATDTIFLIKRELVRVARTINLELELQNAAVLTLGTVVSIGAGEGTPGKLELTFLNCSIRTAGGLIRANINGAPRPSPRVRARVENCLMQQAGADPFIVLIIDANAPVTGDDPPLRWTGRGNVYELGDGWMSLVANSTQQSVFSMDAGEFQRPPYREEVDSRSAMIGFVVPVPKDLSGVRATKDLFELSSAAETPGGVDPRLLP